jgi:hypothetical protein
MTETTSQTLLKGRYNIEKCLSRDAVSETWIGTDKDSAVFIIKIWPYTTEIPDESSRALWNSELRVLYRLCSSRKAEDAILTIRDAGIDKDQRFFVMVLESKGQGYAPLSSGLANRQKHPFLAFKNLRILSARAQVWDALRRLAEGINALHTQQDIHRNISAETVYCNPDIGPESWRLGGFEWSVRLGFSGVSGTATLLNWSQPPEASKGHAAYAFDSDWYAFGMLIVRIFSSIEGLANLPPESLHHRVNEEIEGNANLPMTSLEKDFVRQLIGTSANDRLAYGKEIISSIERIQRALAVGMVDDSTQPLVLAYDKTNQQLVEAALQAGLQPDVANPLTSYNPLDPGHVAALKEFLLKDLEECRLCSSGEGDRWVLVGHALTLRITSYVEYASEDPTPSWDIAFLVGPTDLRGAAPDLSRDLGSIQVLPLPRREAKQHRDHQTWSRFLPKLDVGKTQLTELTRFHEFLRCANQLELLISSAKIFPYKVLERSNDNNGWERLLIQGTPQTRPLPRFSQLKDGLSRLLHDEVASNKPHCSEILLTHNDHLHVFGVESEDWWEVEKVGRPGEASPWQTDST